MFKDFLVDVGYGMGGNVVKGDPEAVGEAFLDYVEHTFVVGNQIRRGIRFGTESGLTEEIRKSQKRGRSGRRVPRAGKERRVNRLKERREALPWR